MPSEIVTFPGARAPERRRSVDSHGVRIEVYEWGDADAPPLALAHGGFDFARTFDVFAPLLADAGWRVVSWDQRGHGASAHAAMYSWESDLRDALSVVDSVTSGPLPVVGHSKGGGVMVQFATALPHRVTAVVNLDGLAKRRAQMNPRLSHEWLRYLVSVGASNGDDGWRWSIDPALRLLDVDEVADVVVGDEPAARGQVGLDVVGRGGPPHELGLEAEHRQHG